MTEFHEHHFWHSRIAQVAGAMALLVIISHLLSYFDGGFIRIDSPLQAGIAPAILALLTLIAAILSYFWSSKKPELRLPLVTQGLLLAMTAALIYTTGGLFSYFLALWVPAVIFIGVFGTRSLLVTAVIPVCYGLWLFFTSGFTLPMGVTTLLIGEVPIILSSLLFTHLAIEREDSSYKQLANQFSQVSDKAEVVITAITNGVIALDKQGIVELINPAAQRLIGWESRDALKLDYKSVLKLVDKESNELTPANDPIERALSTNEEVRSEECTLMTNSGKKLLISLVASPVGQMGSGVIIVFRDITKEKTEEREQAEFISTASHEMRTPVASIEGYLGLALNPATAQIDDKARAFIMKAHEVAQHLGRLFQDLLDVSKAEDGRLSNNPRAVEVVSFVGDVVEGLRPQATAKGLVLVYKPAPDSEDTEKSSRHLNPVFYANVDNDHLREVVANLVENAIKYTKQGTVSIDVGGNDKEVEISVADTGIGVPAEDLPHLFQKFYRVDNSDTREIGGTGLGLYLSRRLVETMEGRIWAESQQGQGSTFFIAIPRISHQEAMERIETLQPAAVGAPAAVPGVTDVAPQPQPIPTPIQTPSVSPSDGVFISLPADAIAAQLPPLSAQPAALPLATPPVPSVQTGPSLAAIEQNPGQYLHSANASAAPQTNANISPESQNQP
jgi:PAS domain S-box-containing protein